MVGAKSLVYGRPASKMLLPLHKTHIAYHAYACESKIAWMVWPPPQCEMADAYTTTSKYKCLPSYACSTQIWILCPNWQNLPHWCNSNTVITKEQGTTQWPELSKTAGWTNQGHGQIRPRRNIFLFQLKHCMSKQNCNSKKCSNDYLIY